MIAGGTISCIAVTIKDVTGATTSATTIPSTNEDKQGYFANRIALSKQRALLANIARCGEGGGGGGDSIQTAIRGWKRRDVATEQVPFVSSPTATITQRLEGSRQRVLLDDIVRKRSAPAVSSTTSSSSSSSSSSTWSAIKNRVTPVPRVANTVTRTLTLEQQRNQQYFAQRIAASRQRALLDNIKSARGGTTTSSLQRVVEKSAVGRDEVVAAPGLITRGVGAARERALLRSIATTKASQRHTAHALSSRSHPKTYHADVMARPYNSKSTNYFARRIEESRQRALLASIVSTKAAQTQTALSGPVRAAASAAVAASKEAVAKTTTKLEPKNYFAQRILAARQNTLLSNIQSTKATQTLTSLPRSSSSSTVNKSQQQQQQQRRQEYFRQRKRASNRVATTPSKGCVPKTTTVSPKPHRQMTRDISKPTTTTMSFNSYQSEQSSSSFDVWESPMMKPFKPSEVTTPNTNSQQVSPSTITTFPQFVAASASDHGMTSKFPLNTIKKTQDEILLEAAARTSEQAKKELEHVKKDVGNLFSTPEQRRPWPFKKPAMEGLDANSVKSTTPQQPWSAASNKVSSIPEPCATEKAADLKQASGTSNANFAANNGVGQKPTTIAAAPKNFVPEPNARLFTGYPWDKKKKENMTNSPSDEFTK